MNVPQINKLSRASQLSLVAVVILLGAVFVTVNSALQEQNGASHASTGTNPTLLTPAIDSSAVNDAGNNAATSGTVTNLTVSSSDTNEIIILGVGLYDGAGGVTVSTSSPPTWGSQTFTKLKSSTFDSGKEDDELWYLIAPATGNHTVTVHFTGNTTYVIGAADYYNVNQTTPFGTVNTTSGNSNSFSNNIPSGPNQLPIDMVAWTAATGISPSGTGQRAVWNKDIASPASASSYAPSTGSTTTLRWSDSSTDYWYDIGVSLLPAIITVTSVPATIIPPTSVPPTLPLATVVPNPTATIAPFAPSPTIQPINNPTPTVTAVSPTISTPKNTPIPGDTYLGLNIGLQGIGTAGDSQTDTLSDCTVAQPPAACDGNMNPLRPTRTVTVDILNASNQEVLKQQGTVTYDTNSGKFLGTVDLGPNFTTGLYTVKVTTDQFLRSIVPGIQTITSGQTMKLPYVSLVAGDIYPDNQINIVDYNILLSCYSDLLPASASCTATNKTLADLTDDGAVNQDDLNLFLRELSNVSGQ